MSIIIRPVDWENPEEVAYCNQDLGGARIFDPSYAQEQHKRGGAIPISFVAIDDILQKNVGRATIGEEDDPEYWVPGVKRPEPWLYGVYVDPDYRNRWIGHALVTRTIEYCRQHAIEVLSLDTLPGVDWYSHNWGFRYSHQALWESRQQMLDVYFLPLHE